MNKRKVNSILKGVAAAGIAIGGVSSIQGADMVMAAVVEEEVKEAIETEEEELVVAKEVSETPSETISESSAEVASETEEEIHSESASYEADEITEDMVSVSETASLGESAEETEASGTNEATAETEAAEESESTDNGLHIEKKTFSEVNKGNKLGSIYWGLSLTWKSLVSGGYMLGGLSYHTSVTSHTDNTVTVEYAPMWASGLKCLTKTVSGQIYKSENGTLVVKSQAGKYYEFRADAVYVSNSFSQDQGGNDQTISDGVKDDNMITEEEYNQGANSDTTGSTETEETEESAGTTETEETEESAGTTETEETEESTGTTETEETEETEESTGTTETEETEESTGTTETEETEETEESTGTTETEETEETEESAGTTETEETEESAGTTETEETEETEESAGSNETEETEESAGSNESTGAGENAGTTGTADVAEVQQTEDEADGTGNNQEAEQATTQNEASQSMQTLTEGTSEIGDESIPLAVNAIEEAEIEATEGLDIVDEDTPLAASQMVGLKTVWGWSAAAAVLAGAKGIYDSRRRKASKKNLNK